MHTVNLFRRNPRLKAKLISLKSSFSIWILKLWQKYWEETWTVTRLLEAGGKNDQATFWEVQELFKVLSQLISYLVLRMSARKSVEGTRFNHHLLQNGRQTGIIQIVAIWRSGSESELRTVDDYNLFQGFIFLFLWATTMKTKNGCRKSQMEPKPKFQRQVTNSKKYHKKLKPILKPGMGQIIWM